MPDGETRRVLSGDGYAESVHRELFDQVMVTSVGRAGELDQACRDGQEAIRMATAVGASQRVHTRLTQLLDDTAQHQREPAVRELREELMAMGVADRTIM